MNPTMSRKSSTARNVILLAGIPLFLLSLAASSYADIYRWEDEAGVIHFTDDPSSIPVKYRGKSKDILKGPPAAGKPSLSTVGSPTPSMGAPSYTPEPASEATGGAPQETVAAQAEQQRAKIAAKEEFIDAIDRKRSNILNPLGNRYVAPADLELYNKYGEELPRDRERLRELEAQSPGGVR